MIIAIRVRTPIQAVLVRVAASNRVTIRIIPPIHQIIAALERIKLIKQADIGPAIARSSPIIDRKRQQLANMARVVMSAVHSIPSSLRFEIVMVLNVMVMAAGAAAAVIVMIVMMAMVMAARVMVRMMAASMMRLVRILDFFYRSRSRRQT